MIAVCQATKLLGLAKDWSGAVATQDQLAANNSTNCRCKWPPVLASCFMDLRPPCWQKNELRIVNFELQLSKEIVLPAKRTQSSGSIIKALSAAGKAAVAAARGANCGIKR